MNRILEIICETAASATTTASIPTDIVAIDLKKRKPEADGVAMGFPFFKASADTFHAAIQGKAKFKHFNKFLNNDSELSNRIKTFRKAFPKKTLLLQNDRTKEFVHLISRGV